MSLKSAEFVLKLGGSAITDKDSPFTPNLDVIEGVAKELADYNPNGRVALVYGGGSFGHYVAEKHLKEGIVSTAAGASEIRSAMLSLSKIVTDVFLKQGLPIFCINASGCFILKGGSVQATFLDPVAFSLRAGLLPAIGGDVVLDEEGGARILSGDRIARLLAINFHSKALLFGTDVDGILTPKGCIKSLRRGEIPTVLENLQGRRGDVTGGMEGKVREIDAYLSEGGSLSVILNIKKRGRLTKILAGEPVEGTYIRPEAIREGLQ